MKNVKLFIRLSFTISIAICLFIYAIPVSAFQYYGYHWDTNVVYYDVSTLPTSWKNCIYAAAIEWNGAGAAFEFDGWTGSDNDITRGYYGDETWLAETAITGYPHITEVDTVFNTRYTWYTDGNDYFVQSTATHELGHWLMLGHTSSSTDAIMYYYYNGETDLKQDDIDGIIYIYGEG